MNGWRGRAGGLAVPILIAAASAAVAVAVATVASASAPTAAPAEQWQLAVRAVNGTVLLRVPLPEARFALRYRNSVYLSLAEERFVVGADGQISLIELAADEAAVLDEYYETGERPRRSSGDDARLWIAPPAAALEVLELQLAATRYGERTLLAAGREVVLSDLVGTAGPGVILEVERVR